MTAFVHNKYICTTNHNTIEPKNTCETLLMSLPLLFYGILCAVLSSIFIGTGFVMQKRALEANAIVAAKKITKSKRWWFSLFLNLTGELLNLAGYSLASPAVITPLGALSVVVSAILSHVWLKEHLTVHGKIACLLCVLGSVLVVLHAPESRHIYSITQFLELALQLQFMIYFGILVVIIGVCTYITIKKPTLLSIVTLAAISASFSVCLVQAVSQGIIAFLNKASTFSFILFIFTGITIGTLLISLYFFNSALTRYNASQVTPIYYVLFTFYTLVTSSLLWGFDSEVKDAATIAISFLVLACGVVILHKE